jgi:hypothetical protein
MVYQVVLRWVKEGTKTIPDGVNLGDWTTTELDSGFWREAVRNQFRIFVVIP